MKNKLNTTKTQKNKMDKRKIKVCTIFLFLFFSLILSSSMVSADKDIIAFEGDKSIKIYSPDIETLKQNEDVTFRIQAINSSDGLRLDNTTTTCAFFSTYKNGTQYYFSAMDYDGANYITTVNGGNFSSTGEYGYGFYCNNSERGGFVSIPLTVTPSGNLFTSGQAITSIAILLLMFGVGGFCLYLSSHFDQSGVKIFFMLSAFVFITGTLAVGHIASYDAGLTAGMNNSVTYILYAFGLIFFVAFAYVLINQIIEAMNLYQRGKGYETEY